MAKGHSKVKQSVPIRLPILSGFILTEDEANDRFLVQAADTTIDLPGGLKGLIIGPEIQWPLFRLPRPAEREAAIARLRKSPRKRGRGRPPMTPAEAAHDEKLRSDLKIAGCGATAFAQRLGIEVKELLNACARDRARKLRTK
jgi:hypothetical protein